MPVLCQVVAGTGATKGRTASREGLIESCELGNDDVRMPFVARDAAGVDDANFGTVRPTECVSAGAAEPPKRGVVVLYIG